MFDPVHSVCAVSPLDLFAATVGPLLLGFVLLGVVAYLVSSWRENENDE